MVAERAASAALSTSLALSPEGTACSCSICRRMAWENIEIVMAAAGQHGVRHQKFGERLGAFMPRIQPVEADFQAGVERPHVLLRIMPVDLEG